jgi:hypothetical protein
MRLESAGRTSRRGFRRHHATERAPIFALPARTCRSCSPDPRGPRRPSKAKCGRAAGRRWATRCGCRVALASEHVLAGLQWHAPAVLDQPAQAGGRRGRRDGVIRRAAERVADPLRRPDEPRRARVVGQRVANLGDQAGQVAVRHERVRPELLVWSSFFVSTRGRASTRAFSRSNASVRDEPRSHRAGVAGCPRQRSSRQVGASREGHAL